MRETELIEYTTAERLAAVYCEQTRRIEDAITQLQEAASALGQAFGSSGFGIGVEYEGRTNPTLDDVRDAMKRAAWRAILDKLNIWRTMSSQRAEQLQDALYRGNRPRNYRQEPVVEFPEINPQTIVEVASGYRESATEFLEEAVREEYDFWKPSKLHADYKRNDEFRLNRRIIRPRVVEPTWNNAGFQCRHDYASHVRALDNIFHMLAGRGPFSEFKGPLASAIETCGASGQGETEFFRFRCHKNGNLHLEFRRLDVLELFNKIAGRDRLPGAR